LSGIEIARPQDLLKVLIRDRKGRALVTDRRFLYSAKTSVPVYIPLPDFVVKEVRKAGGPGRSRSWPLPINCAIKPLARR
jgi:hypothetical protein